MLLDSRAKTTSVNFQPKGWRDDLYPFHIFLYFEKNQLQKIRLDRDGDFCMHFYGEHPSEDMVTEWFIDYFEGKQSLFPLPLQFQLPPFGSRVLEELKKVPFGETVSYKELATRAGSPKAARAAGNVCNANPFPLVIPCHRIVHADGSVGGFAYGSQMKADLLNFEKSSING